MKATFKQMRLLLMFDLPTLSKVDRREAQKFRTEIVKDGFEMLQFSVYARFCRNIQDANKHINHITNIAPNSGNIRIISLTENQFDNMLLIIGEKTENEQLVKNEYLVTIE